MQHTFTQVRIWPRWLLGLFVTLWVTTSAYAQISNFTAAKVEDGTDCNWPFSAMATNPVDGKIYALWRKGANENVTYKLIRWDGSAWTVVSTFTTATGTTSSNKVPDFGSASDYVSLAIDGLGRFHVAFKGLVNSVGREGIWYGLSPTGTTWSFQALQALPANSINQSLLDQVIEVDPENQPHVAFLYTTAEAPRSYTLRYFRLVSGSWVGETAITQSGTTPGGTASNEIARFDLAIDRNAKAHFSFRRELNGTGRDGSLFYINNTSGSWSTPQELVAGNTGQAQGVTNTIDTDAANNVHIVHSDYQSKLYYTTNESGSFVTSQINGNVTGDVWSKHSLRINGKGDKFVVYKDDIGSPTKLNYAYQLAGTSGSWTTGTAYTPTVAGNGGNFYSGLMNDDRRIMVLFDNSLTSTRGQCSEFRRDLWYATATVQAPATPAPSFTQSPASTGVCTGNTATFTATATGATSFQWQQDDNTGFSSPTTVNSTGIYSITTTGTTSRLTINSNASLNGQYFRAVATNGTGSTNSSGALLTVNALPTVAITGLASAYCKDATAVTLTGSPTGGSFTVDGTPASSFNPSVLATGSHTVIYRYTNGNGCTNSASQNVTVNPLPVVAITALASAYCKDASAITLTGSPTGGTFTIDGTTATSFDPSALAMGSHAVVYRYTNGNGCTNTASQTVTVNPLPVVAITGLANAYCQDGVAVTLTATPAGGSFTIDGTAATQFNSAKLQVGTRTVGYTYTDANGCTNSTTQSVTVNALPVVSITGLSSAYCQDASPVTLLGNPTEAGGSFTIDGMSASMLTPMSLTVGQHTVGYRFTDGNSCSNSTTQTITIKATPPAPSLLTQTGQSYPGSQSAVTVDLNTGNVTLVASNCAGTVNWTGPNNTAGSGTSIIVPTTQAGAFTYQASCTIDGCASPLATATVTVGARLTVLHRDVDNYADNNAIQPLLVLQNNSTGTLPLSRLTLRYYVTVENGGTLGNLSLNYAQVGNQNVRLRYVPLSPTQQGATGYVEYSFTDGAGNLAAGANSGPIQGYFTKSDYGSLYEPDDYSYNPFRDQLTGNLRITAYYDGVLISGLEPGSTAQVRAVRALTESRNGPSATQINTVLEVRNEGNVAINYSDLRARYYFTADGNERLLVEVDEGNVSTQLVKLSTPVNGADYYLEIRYNQGGQLAAGASTGAIRYRISKPDGGRFNQANDYSYQEQPQDRSQNSRVVVYTGSERIWGQEPSGSARVAFAEVGSELSVKVLGNPVREEQVSFEVTGAAGQPLQLRLVNAQGRVIAEQQVPVGEPTQRHQLPISGQAGSLFLLQVSIPTQSQTVKVIKAN